MKCLFCNYEYNKPNPFVSSKIVMEIIIKHMEDNHEQLLEYKMSELLEIELITNQKYESLKQRLMKQGILMDGSKHCGQC